MTAVRCTTRHSLLVILSRSWVSAAAMFARRRCRYMILALLAVAIVDRSLGSDNNLRRLPSSTNARPTATTTTCEKDQSKTICFKNHDSSFTSDNDHRRCMTATAASSTHAEHGRPRRDTIGIVGDTTPKVRSSTVSGRDGSLQADRRRLAGKLTARFSAEALGRVRGGSAGGWRVVDQEERRERQTVRSVLLYYPNLIGYARVALVLMSYYLAETNWKTRFGAVLDMVTDRCSTAGLLLVLSRLYDRSHAFAFLSLMFVDLFSHWMHTASVSGPHHKAAASLRRRNVLIRTYYDNLYFFAFCCIGTELFYVLLYLLYFVADESLAFFILREACYFVCLPACVLKQVVNLAQIGSAARSLALEELDSPCEAPSREQS